MAAIDHATNLLMFAFYRVEPTSADLIAFLKSIFGRYGSAGCPLGDSGLVTNTCFWLASLWQRYNADWGGQMRSKAFVEALEYFGRQYSTMFHGLAYRPHDHAKIRKSIL